MCLLLPFRPGKQGSHFYFRSFADSIYHVQARFLPLYIVVYINYDMLMEMNTKF